VKRSTCACAVRSRCNGDTETYPAPTASRSVINVCGAAWAPGSLWLTGFFRVGFAASHLLAVCVLSDGCLPCRVKRTEPFHV